MIRFFAGPSQGSLGKLLGLLLIGGVLLAQACSKPLSDEEYLQQARDYEAKGELQAAVIELKNALQKNPTNIEARTLLGKLDVRLGDGPSAQKELEMALEKGALYETVVNALGKAYWLQQNYQKIIDTVKPRDSMQEPFKAEILTLRGNAYLALGNRSEAKQAFRDALAQQASWVDAMLGMGQVALMQNDKDEARKWLDKAIATAPDKPEVWILEGDYQQQKDNLPAAEAAYNKALMLDAKHFTARLQLISVLLSQQKLDEAGKALELVKGKQRNHPRVLYSLAAVAYGKKDYKAAQDYLLQLLKNYPDDPPALYLMAGTQYALGNVGQAENNLKPLLAKFPDSPELQRLNALIKLRTEGADPVKLKAALDRLAVQFPNDPLILNMLASNLAAQGKPTEATQYLKKAAELQPQSAAARSRLGTALLEQGKPEEAIPELEKATELAPQSLEADIQLISGYITAKKFDQALEALQPLRQKYPKDIDLWNLIGIAYFGKGQLDKAEEAYRKVLEIDPGNPSAAVNLAQFALLAGNIDKARNYYQQALERYPDNLMVLLKLAEMESRLGNKEAYVKRLDEAIQKQPRALQPRLLRARAYMAESKPEQALALLIEIQGEQGTNPEFLQTLGEVQVMAGNLDTAIQTFNKLTNLKPDSALGFYSLAATYARKGDLNAARTPLFKALQLQPDHPVAGFTMAQLLSLAQNKDKEEANQLLLALKKQLPKNRQVLLLEGQFAFRQADYQKAIKAYQEAHNLFPDDSEITLKLAATYLAANNQTAFFNTLQPWLAKHPQDIKAQFMLANAYLKLKRYDEATSVFNKLLELTPNDVLVLNNLAWLLRKQNPEQARQYAEKALALKSDDVDVMDTLAVILLDLGDRKDALELLQRAAQAQPKELIIRYHLAKALVENGQKDEARKLLQEMLTDQTDFESRQETSTLLKELGD